MSPKGEGYEREKLVDFKRKCGGGGRGGGGSSRKWEMKRNVRGKDIKDREKIEVEKRGRKRGEWEK